MQRSPTSPSRWMALPWGDRNRSRVGSAKTPDCCDIYAMPGVSEGSPAPEHCGSNDGGRFQCREVGSAVAEQLVKRLADFPETLGRVAPLRRKRALNLRRLLALQAPAEFRRKDGASLTVDRKRRGHEVA